MRSWGVRPAVSADTCDGSLKGAKALGGEILKSRSDGRLFFVVLSSSRSRRRRGGAAGLPVRRHQPAHLQGRREAQTGGPVSRVVVGFFFFFNGVTNVSSLWRTESRTGGESAPSKPGRRTTYPPATPPKSTTGRCDRLGPSGRGGGRGTGVDCDVSFLAARPQGGCSRGWRGRRPRSCSASPGTEWAPSWCERAPGREVSVGTSRP